MKKLIDKRLFLILGAFYSIYAIINTLKNGILKHYKIDFKEISWIRFLFDNFFVESLFNISLIAFIIVLTKKLIDKNYKWYFIFGIHFILSFVTVILIYFIYDTYLYLFNNLTFERSFRYYLLNIANYSNTHFLFYFVNVFIIFIYYFMKRNSEIELQKVQLSNQLANVKMNVLKYQLHPHFLFNTLNSISSLIESNSKLAQDTIADFGDLLRDLLNLKDANLIPLQEEINISKRYLDIMTLRFSDHLSVILNIDKNIVKTLVPSLILLPILENSIKHGYSYNNTDLTIELSISKNKNKVIIEIKNNGSPLKKGKIKYGHGLQNTIDRLELLYKMDFTYSMENLENKKGIITTIIFPINP